MPSDIRKMLAEGGANEAARYGLNPDLAQPAGNAATRNRPWAVPGRGHICLVVPNLDRNTRAYTMPCATTAEAVAGAIHTNLIAAPAGPHSASQLVGLAPDTKGHARFRDRTSAVADNAYEIRTTGLPRVVLDR